MRRHRNGVAGAPVPSSEEAGQPPNLTSLFRYHLIDSRREEISVRVMVFVDWFDPGFIAGTTRSCVNFVRLMKDEFEIFVFTSDRDLNQSEPYGSVELSRWVPYDDNVSVYYSEPHRSTWSNIARQIREVDPDVVYLNSMFSPRFTIYPLLMRRLGVIRARVVLAPRGMLRESALRFKPLRKRVYLAAFRLLNLHRLVRFHATDATERNDILQRFGSADVILAPDSFGGVGAYAGSIEKKEKELSIIFVGRLHPIKNLDYLLRLLPGLEGKITLTVLGSEEDPEYVQQCREIALSLGPDVSVSFMGGVPNDVVADMIARHHLLVSPTRGENFGHAIFEALAVSRPVLISDQTPWRDLRQARAGWDLPLESEDTFLETLQQVVDFGQEAYDEYSIGAWRHVRGFVEQSRIADRYRELLST